MEEAQKKCSKSCVVLAATLSGHCMKFLSMDKCRPHPPLKRGGGDGGCHHVHKLQYGMAGAAVVPPSGNSGELNKQDVKECKLARASSTAVLAATLSVHCSQMSKNCMRYDEVVNFSLHKKWVLWLLLPFLPPGNTVVLLERLYLQQFMYML